MPRPYEVLINRIADEERVPRVVAQALVDTENSQRDPTLVKMEAWGGGSYGLSMVTLWTAREYGFRGEPDALKDPATHLRFGFRYLRAMFDMIGESDWIRARAAYVAGPDLSPWPEADLERFARNLKRWNGPPLGFPKPPLLLAGSGGLMLGLIVVGLFVPALLKLTKGGQR